MCWPYHSLYCTIPYPFLLHNLGGRGWGGGACRLHNNTVCVRPAVGNIQVMGGPNANWYASCTHLTCLAGLCRDASPNRIHLCLCYVYHILGTCWIVCAMSHFKEGYSLAVRLFILILVCTHNKWFGKDCCFRNVCMCVCTLYPMLYQLHHFMLHLMFAVFTASVYGLYEP